jgi:outer membrane protein assembly factor BamB
MQFVGVVPLGRRPGEWQLLLSYLPTLLVLFLCAFVLGMLVKRTPWPRVVGILSWRVRLAIAGIMVLAPLVLWLAASRPSRSQPVSPGQFVGQWSTFMANPRRSGNTDGSAGPRKGRKLWTFRDALSRAPFAASPAVVDGRVYVGSDNRQLYCLNADTGEVIWTFKAAYELFASPVVAEGRVYVGEGLHHHSDAKVYCLDAGTGGKLWEFKTAGHVEFSATLFDGRVYLGAGGDGVYCLDARTGRKLWQYPTVHVDMSPVVSERGVFFGSAYGSPAFYCVSAGDGQLIWKTPAPYGVSGSPATDGQRIYFGLGNGTFVMSHANPLGSVYCLSSEDGRVLWKREVKDAVLTAVALAGGRAYFGSRDGHVYCVSADTGEEHWAFAAADAVVSSPAVAGGYVYFGGNDGVVYCVDGASGKEVWSYDTSQAAFNSEAAVMASPAVAGGRVYVGSMNFVFFCLGEPANR